MKATAIVKGCVLENKSTEVAMSSNNVIGFFFLTKLVSIVLAHVFSRFTNQRRRDQATMHSTEKTPSKYTSNSQHVEGMHEDVMFSLEHQHVIKRTADPKWHSIREGTLTEGVDEEDSSSCSNWSRVSNKDPGTHP